MGCRIRRARFFSKGTVRHSSLRDAVTNENSEYVRFRMKRQVKQKLSPLQRRRLRCTVAALALAAFLWLVFAPGTGLLALWHKRAELHALQQKSARLTKENEKLHREIDRLQHDPAYLEEVARRDYGLLKKNERVYDFSKQSDEKKK